MFISNRDIFMKSLLDQLKLCLITNITTQSISEYIEFIRNTIHAGVTMVQLREKSINYSEIRSRALALQKALRPLEIPLIINDFVELAAEINADGVHVGNQDMSAIKARKLLGTNKIIGVSVESLEDVEFTNKLPIDYITASAIFPTKTKSNCKKFWGIDGLIEVVKKSTHPVTAIGGITVNNSKDIIKTGATGIAVISTIHDAINPYEATKNLRINLENI